MYLAESNKNKKTPKKDPLKDIISETSVQVVLSHWKVLKVLPAHCCSVKERCQHCIFDGKLSSGSNKNKNTPKKDPLKDICAVCSLSLKSDSSISITAAVWKSAADIVFGAEVSAGSNFNFLS